MVVSDIVFLQKETIPKLVKYPSTKVFWDVNYVISTVNYVLSIITFNSVDLVPLYLAPFTVSVKLLTLICVFRFNLFRHCRGWLVVPSGLLVFCLYSEQPRVVTLRPLCEATLQSPTGRLCVCLEWVLGLSFGFVSLSEGSLLQEVTHFPLLESRLRPRDDVHTLTSYYLSQPSPPTWATVFISFHLLWIPPLWGTTQVYEN